MVVVGFKRIEIRIFALVLMALLVAGPMPSYAYEAAVGNRAADFTGFDIVNRETIHLEDSLGQWVFMEFWATWCRPCREAVPKLNAMQRRFADDLVVIGISDEEEAVVRRMLEPRIEFPLAIDTRARMKEELAVKGIPHVIVVEPGGFVVWEGFPLLEGHQLTEEVMARILKAGSIGSKLERSEE